MRKKKEPKYEVNLSFVDCNGLYEQDRTLPVLLRLTHSLTVPYTCTIAARDSYRSDLNLLAIRRSLFAHFRYL